MGLRYYKHSLSLDLVVTAEVCMNRKTHKIHLKRSAVYSMCSIGIVFIGICIYNTYNNVFIDV